MQDNTLIPKAWLDFVPSLKNGRHLRLLAEIEQMRKAGKKIYPKQNDIFYALHLTVPSMVKVIILGQDPYHGEGQAHGLCFSVPNSVKIPPSLRNIFLEMNTDIYGGQDKTSQSTDLSYLAQQGVLLLNTILSVEEGKPQSHAKLGWQEITHDILQSIAKSQDCAVLLWGKPASTYAEIFTQSEHEHLVLQATHPSPLSAHRGFFGCKHFSKVNTWLHAHNKTPIQW